MAVQIIKKSLTSLLLLGLIVPSGILWPKRAYAALSIRQEINIIDGIVTAAGDNAAKVTIDTTKYSGATYYFEVVAKVDSGSLTVALEREGTATQDKTVSVTSTSYARVRSTAFTPPAGSTNYQINLSGGTNPMVKAARIIIIQSSLTDTQTQIEVGNLETGKNNTATSPLSNPKYWKYTSSKWDGTVSAYAEVTYLNTQSSTYTASSTTYSSAGTYTVVIPASATSTVIELWGGGGAGGAATVNTNGSGSGGAGGQYAKKTITSLGGASKTLVVAGIQAGGAGSGSAGNDSTWDTNVVVAKGGAGGALDSGTAGAGSTLNGVGDVVNAGGNGAAGVSGGTSGGGGEGGRSTGTGGSASGGTAGTGGDGGDGGAGRSTIGAGNPGNSPGGGGAGGRSTTNPNQNGGDGASGQAIVSNGVLLSGNETVGIALEEDDGSFGSWTFKKQIVSAGSASSATLVRSASFVPVDGRHYRITASTTASSGSYDIYNAKIIIDQTSSPTLLEPQYLIANTGSFGGSTGLKDFDTLYDPAEWSEVAITFIHEANGTAGGTGDTKLQSDPNGTPADITGSDITNVVEVEQSSSMTMPGSSATIDVNVTGTGTLNASRILVQMDVATVPDAPTSLSTADGTNKVNLSWTAPASNGGLPITNYKIYRDTSANPTTLIDTIGNVISYEDTNVSNGTLYYYRVKAVNSVGDSAYSNESSATPTSGITPRRVIIRGGNSKFKIFGGRVLFR